MKANKEAGGVDGESIEMFEAGLQERLDQLHEELKADCYRPLPMRRKPIAKPHKPNEQRNLDIPAIYDRVCQQALVNCLDPVFEPVFDAASFGYPPRRQANEAQWRGLRPVGPLAQHTECSTRPIVQNQRAVVIATYPITPIVAIL